MDFPISELLSDAIRKQFGRNAERIVRLDGGFSGTPIYQISLNSQFWVVRGWPCSVESHTKIRNWSRVASHLNLNVAELDPWFLSPPIPSPEPWHHFVSSDPLSLSASETLWTLAKWVPGKPLHSDQIRYEHVVDYVKQLAGLHRLVRRMEKRRDQSLGLRERVELLHDMPVNLQTIAHTCSRHPLSRELSQFVMHCHDRLSSWLNSLRCLASGECEVHWILRDLWRDNLLVNADNRWIHTVDVGASRIDWPAFDLIRLVGSLFDAIRNRRVDDIWQELRVAYQSVHAEFELPDVEDLKTIHQISTALSVIYWCKKSYKQDAALVLASHEIQRMQELLRTFLAD